MSSKIVTRQIDGDKDHRLIGRKTLFEDDDAVNMLAGSVTRGGPPNRMNDLPYRDWMKFQKSFFRFDTWSNLLTELICFFTKEKWSDGTASSSLLIGVEEAPGATKFGARSIRTIGTSSIADIFATVSELADEGDLHDFIVVYLRGLGASNFARFSDDLEGLFANTRRMLRQSKYCCLITDFRQQDAPFPVPWSIAQGARSHLKLRDEKIGIVESDQFCRYCLFFQADDDAIRAIKWLPEDINVEHEPPSVPPWVMPKSPPRKADEIFHPAKFPESLVSRFIQMFTTEGGTVLDPMVGTGSALVAAMRQGRSGIGIELNATFAETARNRIKAENPSLLLGRTHAEVHTADARDVAQIVPPGSIDYCITSPPYWSMLANSGSENQKARREKDLPMVYSEDQRDVGNVNNYGDFLKLLTGIYESAASCLKVGAYLTVVVKNVKREHVVYPLAWDLVRLLAHKDGKYAFAATTLWCQDDVSIKPFAVGIHWVSNTLHTYCLHFRRR